MKIFVLRPNWDMFSLEEIEYQTHEERYQATKGIDPKFIFEEKDIDKAIAKLVDLNSI
jgi:hypothetical protein